MGGGWPTCAGWRWEDGVRQWAGDGGRLTCARGGGGRGEAVGRGWQMAHPVRERGGNRGGRQWAGDALPYPTLPHLYEASVHALDQLLRVVPLQTKRLPALLHTFLPLSDLRHRLGVKLIGGLKRLAWATPVRERREGMVQCR